jgi:hypothetical protein
MMAIRAKRKAKRQPEVYYALRIQSWEWDYSFGIADTRLFPGEVYEDYRHLTIRGELTRPAALAGQKIGLTFVPQRDIFQPASKFLNKPERVGHLQRSRNTKALEGTLAMPAETLPSILSMLIAERLRFVTFASTDLFRGAAQIREYRLHETVADDDLPSEE